MASRQSVSSILKPPKVRAPLKEIEPVDQDGDENTASLPKRKVSFSGMNKIKMYNTGATSLTVHQAPMFDEQISMLSDSSNGEKTKLSGKFEKSDSQITNESTNCTNVENNGLVMEYESPNDNMEITEAFAGKIFSENTIYNNGSEQTDFSLDYSENNMEFTEAIKVGQILTVNESELSETLNNEDEEQSETQFDLESTTPLCNKSTSDTTLNSSNMNFTCTNTKLNSKNSTFVNAQPSIMNVSDMNTQPSSMEMTCVSTKLNSKNSTFLNAQPSIMNVTDMYTQPSNMDLTCMTIKSHKSILSNDYDKSFNMELSQLPDTETCKNSGEFGHEYGEHLMSIVSDTSYEIKEISNYDPKIIPSDILSTKSLDINNFSNQQINNDDDIDEKLSYSMVSMDVDSTSDGNDIIYVDIDGTESVVTKENNFTVHTEIAKSNEYPVDNVQNKDSSEIDIIDVSYQNMRSTTLIGSSLIQEISLEKLNESVGGKEQLSKNMSFTRPLVFEQHEFSEKSMFTHEQNEEQVNSGRSIISTDLLKAQEEYSGKCTNVDNQHQLLENEDLSDKSIDIGKSNNKCYSRKSFGPKSVLNKVQFSEHKNMSDSSSTDEENKQNSYSKKSIGPESVLSQIQSSEYEDISDTSLMAEENQQEKYSRKSIAPSSVFNQTQSSEYEDISDVSEVVEKNQQNRYSRKSLAPVNFLNQTQSSNKEDNLEISTMVEKSQQEKYSRKSIAPSSDFDQIHTSSSGYEDVSYTSTMAENNQQKCYSRKSFGPNSVLIQNQPSEYEDISDTSPVAEENKQKCYSRKSIGPKSVLSQIQSSEYEDISDTSLMVEENQQGKYSRKSIVPKSIFNQTQSSKKDDLSDTFEIDEAVSDNYEEKSIPIVQTQLLSVNSDDDLNSPFRKKSKKSVILTNSPKQYIENKCFENVVSLNNSENSNVNKTSENLDEYISKMDISMEVVPENESFANNSCKEPSVTSASSSISNNSSKLSSNYLTEGENLSDSMNEKKSDRSGILSSNERSCNQFSETLKEDKELNENNKSENSKDGVIKNNEINVKDDTEFGNESLKKIDDSLSRSSADEGINELCIENLSNMSISDETVQNEEKTVSKNRKRSYSNRDCAPLSSSTFVATSSVQNCLPEDFTKDDLFKESPIKKDITKEDSINEEFLMGNSAEVNVKEELVQEPLNNEVLEFLSRWNNQFVEKKLVLSKCTNSEWVFSLLDGNVILTIKYLSVLNNQSFLKVEDILLTKITTQNEILKIGIEWISFKYNPKIYKCICFTSKDVELLLKSLLEDVNFVSKVMNNMSYVSDLYCVTYKDNKAQFVLHNMNGPLMVCLDVSLSNIHKLSVNDVAIDCVFGSFNKQTLVNVMESITQDCNILQSLIEGLRKIVCLR